LADKVALSPSPCLRRVKLLEEEGYITKQVVLLNAQKIGLNLTVMILVGLNTHQADVMKSFEETIKLMPEVVQCLLITGHSADHLLKAITPNLEAYQYFLLNKLTVIPGVNAVHSSFVLRTICDTTELPLDHIN
jgi:Lrp/AsnC family transcriptional regulator, leucine-responsive regulatory protein